ncbi:hypothetical protein BOX37_03500 [Nocardia mangyaensis]|uniref:Adenylate kinase n=1 Tax=Nocardia mangyaensis TaxID=2213200 RepID=A0A1J0VME0_9NOCA|nr:hypothetical protein [Nocardia mangyaensis]APE33184.1 hypothetical protein BOX37_03500 [Nocardia mangyaensis]
MALSLLVPILGPPASGKTTLTLALGKSPDRHVFRLREHVPPEVVRQTASHGPRDLGWIDDDVVNPAVRLYLSTVATDSRIHTVLLDNYPGTGQQVEALLGIARELAPGCAVEPIELVLDAPARRKRARARRVCHRCERDPAADPRLPASASTFGGWICGNCGSLLHPRRGDAPSLFAARTRRHDDTVEDVRIAFDRAGIPTNSVDAADDAATLARIVEPLLIVRSTTA